jgi:hypothetical protein
MSSKKIKKMDNNFNMILNVLLLMGLLMITLYFIHPNELKGKLALGISIYSLFTFIYLSVMLKLGIGVKKTKQIQE